MINMKKTFEHKDIEICKLCQKKIYTKKDKWVALLDYVDSQLFSVGFYHNFCLNDLIQGKGEIIEKNFENKLGEFTRRILMNAGLR